MIDYKKTTKASLINSIFKILTLLLAISMGLSVMPVNFVAADNTDKKQIMVSLGDSYSSGEGIEPFYGQDDSISKKINNPDWLAHRSQNAWPGMLSLSSVSKRMSEYKDEYWFFAAASGAVTHNMLNGFNKDYKKGRYFGSYELPAQLSVFDGLEAGSVKYVTLTLGGNDAGFEDIISTSILSGKYLNPNALADKMNNTWENFFKSGGIRDNLYNAYVNIAKKAGKQAHIIVAGYPKLLNPEGAFMISPEEAALVNENVTKFNNAIQSIIKSCQGQGMQISFVSVEEAFEGHAAYSKDPYIKNVILGAKAQDLKDNSFISSYSIHPNEKGAYAYAGCVQQRINELEDISGGIYGNNFTVSVYDINGQLYDNYKIEINGKKFNEFVDFDLFSQKYSKTVNVDSAKEVKINLPRGNYTLTVTDAANKGNKYTRNIKIRSNSKNKDLIFKTVFGTGDNQFDIQRANIPDGAVEYNGHYYYLYTDGTADSYEEAFKYCNDRGGYLATLTSEEENNFVYSYILQRGYNNAYFGLSESLNKGQWEWCTGEPLSYTNWHSKEPNKENSNEDYAMFYYKFSDGTWNDGDFGQDTVNSGKAFICEWGNYSVKESKPSEERNIVLTLDVSGSMSGKPLEETKKASVNFINTVLKKDASIGIVTYDDASKIASGFSDGKESLKGIISGLYDGGGTNIEAGLRDAQWMLEKTNAKKKIIVLMSDGEPNEGLQGEELISYAEQIKASGTLIYTIGFFESLNDKGAAQYLMEHIASDGCHYEVAEANELVFFFEDMADQINGQKYIYVRIACPVDVSVTYGGEILSSSEKDLNARTSFGTLTFEENKTEQSETDDRVKVLRLKEGADYNIELRGTGRGSMDYTIGFMDDNGDYSDLRKFKRIKITRRTQIDTVASNSDESILNIDEDGDGKYDLKMRAKANGYGEEVKTLSLIIYVIIGATLSVAIVIIVTLLYLRHKKRKRSNAG